MPKSNEREYRNVTLPLEIRAAEGGGESYIVDGYATTFDSPYLLFELADGTKVYEEIDRHALDEADMSDVIMQYDHTGKVYARQSNSTLKLIVNDRGLKIWADLCKTDGAKELYRDIQAKMITRMSWAFVIAKDGETYKEKDGVVLRTITKIQKVYDVSAVSIPANNDTEIEARSLVGRRYQQIRQEQLNRRVKLLKIKILLTK